MSDLEESLKLSVRTLEACYHEPAPSTQHPAPSTQHTLPGRNAGRDVHRKAGAMVSHGQVDLGLNMLASC